MPFGLKNAGSTYQKMVTRMFESQIGQTVEAYIDDMFAKSRHTSEHLRDLEEVISVLRKHKLHRNASKCSFSVSLRKFLGYMITQRGIEVHLNQTRAINDLHPLRNPKGVCYRFW